MVLSTTNRLWAIAAMAGLLGLSSCKNERGLEPFAEKLEIQNKGSVTASEGTVTLKHDWLYFKDKRSFESTIASLEKMQESGDLDKWSNQFKGFTSWRSAEPEEVEGKSDQESRIDIPDPMLTTLLSATGRIQIADTIYQLSHDGKEPILYAVPQISYAPLMKGVGPQRIPTAVAHKVGLHLMPIFPKWEDNERVVTPYPVAPICDYPNQLLFPWWGQKGDYIYKDNLGNQLAKDNGREVRIDYHRWRVGFLFYSSIGVRVKIYKHTRLGGWMSTVNMQDVGFMACSKGLIVIPGLLPVPYDAQVSAGGYNTNKLERTLKWAAAPMHVEVIPHHFNFNFAVTYRDQHISRFIRE
ncbi:hypothetical protein [Sphingobacterium faecium]|uniref:hypothetical protein n=1 Tax=Sphingobacterium faecium TaxID=34087 RepID=UPI000D388142|nr:hypothetical protein [Sphingobacterium faecium]PTX09478.1 hypothetical protein C8N37_106106 [Sphingobacterium faecium]